MLINFRFKNFRSFYEETLFSMEATTDNSFKEFNLISLDSENVPSKISDNLLKSAVVFGSNATGKTNLLRALHYMQYIILDSLADSNNAINVNETFALYKDAYLNDSLFEVELIENKQYYKYGFILNQGKINQEWLYKYKNKQVNVFTRENNMLTKIAAKDKPIINIISSLSDTELFILLGTKLKLSDVKALEDVRTWFKNLLIIPEGRYTKFNVYLNNTIKEKACNILKQADIGIKDIKVKKAKVNSTSDNTNSIETPVVINKQQRILNQNEQNEVYTLDLATTLNIYNSNKEKVEDKEFMLLKDLDFYSAGTVKLLNCLGFFIIALEEGRVLLMDEIDSRLHYIIVKYLINDMFNSKDQNPNNAQLICTAHNLMLMNEGLRRDQIYFVSKDEYGESHLSAISDFKGIRKTDSFTKQYLAGLFTNLPNM